MSGLSGVSEPKAWFFSAGTNISDAFAVVSDIGGLYGSDSESNGGVTATASWSTHTFLAGPRVQGRSGPISFYGKFLVGVARTSAAVSVSGAGVAQP